MLTRKGDLDAADRQIDAGLATANEPLRAWLLALRAAISLARGDSSRALTCTSEAMTIYTRLGGIEEGAALLRLTHAKALHAASREDEAKNVLADARDVLRERAARLSDDALRETFLRCVPEHAETLALAKAWLGGTKIGIAG
jgi:eukaryotic-like serine/threonine-protein kinase